MNLFAYLQSLHKKAPVPGSSGVARSRVKSALLRDRSQGATETLEMLAADLLKTVAGYMDPAGGALLQLQQGDHRPAITLSCGKAIPFGADYDGPELLATIPLKSLHRHSRA